MHNSEELERFEQFQGGNTEAFAYFYQLHHKGIFDYIRRLGADRALAQDITQDAFKRMWDIRRRAKNARHLVALLYLMARHMFLQELRKVRTAFDVERDLAYITGQQTVMNKELELACSHTLVALDAALNMLSPMRKLVLHFLYIERRTVKEVARMLRISEQTVRNHKSQALNFLREKLYDRDLLLPMILTALLLYLKDA